MVYSCVIENGEKLILITKPKASQRMENRTKVFVYSL